MKNYNELKKNVNIILKRNPLIDIELADLFKALSFIVPNQHSIYLKEGHFLLVFHRCFSDGGGQLYNIKIPFNKSIKNFSEREIWWILSALTEF